MTGRRGRRTRGTSWPPFFKAPDDSHAYPKDRTDAQRAARELTDEDREELARLDAQAAEQEEDEETDRG